MKTYLISELAEEFDTSKTQIRRIIKENNLVAVNETTREHKYIAKEYSEHSRVIVRLEYQPEHHRNSVRTKSEQNRNIKKQENQLSNEIIEILKSDKERLIKELDELKQDKRDQEQRFHDEKQSFHSLIREEKKRSELLLIELQESKEEENTNDIIHEEKKSKWYDVFNRNK